MSFLSPLQEKAYGRHHLRLAWTESSRFELLSWFGHPVEAVVDFSGVESVFCSDTDIKEEYFPDEEWLTAGLFCAPADFLSI